jgi:Bacterial Ig-like domain (group 3)
LLNATSARVSLASTPNPSRKGQSVTFTAQVLAVPHGGAKQTGSVAFLSGTHALAAQPLVRGVETFATPNLASGRNSITARYSGDRRFLRAVSPALSQSARP